MAKLRERQKARRMLVQALYSWDVGGADIATVDAQFRAVNDMTKVDDELFRGVLFGVAQHLSEIEDAIQPHLDREKDQLDPISRAVLRLSTYELLHSIEVPYRVVINEGVNLAKTFGPEDAFKFVNGVLDGIAARSRAAEVADRSRGG